MVRLAKILSEEANKVARLLLVVPIRTLYDPHSPQTGVLTAPQILALRTAAKPLQLAAWLLLTAYGKLQTPYPTVPPPTPYGHLFFQNRGPDLKNVHCKHFGALLRFCSEIVLKIVKYLMKL